MSAESIRRVIFEPGNPHDLSRDELEELATEIREEFPELEVEVFVGEEHGYGVTLSEVLRIYMEIGEVAGATAAIGAPFWATVRWAKKRWHRDREANPDELPRPRFVTVYGPDGETLKSVKIDAPDGEVEEDEGPRSGHRRPWPPARGD